MPIGVKNAGLSSVGQLLLNVVTKNETKGIQQFNKNTKSNKKLNFELKPTCKAWSDVKLHTS